MQDNTSKTPEQAAETPEYAKPENWRLGFLYYNPNDPNVIVPKRWGPRWGSTLNFARAGAYGLLAIPLVLGAAICAAVILFGH